MKKIRVIIALVCALACLMGSGFVPSVKVIAEAAEYPTNLTEIYPSDFGMVDAVYTTWKEYTCKNASSLVGTIFTADIKHTGPETGFNYASTGGWDGIVFHLREDTIIISDSSKTMFTESFTMTEETAGVEFSGETYRLQISVEACDSDSDGESDDAKLGVFFNYNLYDNTYFYLKDAAAKLSNKIVIRTNHGGVSGKVSVLEISSPTKINSDNYLNITPADLGLLDGEHTDAQSDINVGLDGKKLSATLSLKNEGDYIDYSGIRLQTNKLGGITISDSTGNSSFESEDIYTDISDLKVITPADFGLEYGTHTAKSYGGIYGGTNLENTYFTAKFKFSCNDAVPSFCYGGADIWTGLQINFTENLITVRDTLTAIYGYQITPQDIGLSSFKDGDMSVGFDLGISVRYGDYDSDGVKDDLQYGIFISGKLIKNKFAYVYDFVDENGGTEIDGKFGRYCLIYAPTKTIEDTETVVSSSLKVTSPTIYPPLDTEEFDLEIVTRDIDSDADAIKDDLEAKIYIDSTLYKTVNITDYKAENKLSAKLKLKGSVKSNPKTISYKDEVLSFSDLGVTSENLSAERSIGIDSAKIISGNIGCSENSSASVSLSKKAGAVSLFDFGITNGDYTSANAAEGSTAADLVKSSFSVSLKFSDVTDIYYAGKTAETGIKFSFASSGLSMYTANGTRIGNVSAKNALGSTTMANVAFMFGITMNIADTDSDGVKDDILLGVWFNDNFYKSYKVANAAADIGGCLKIAPAYSGITVNIQNSTGKFPYEDGAVLPESVQKTDIFALGFSAANSTLDIEGTLSSSVELENQNTFSFDLWLEPFSLDDDRAVNDLIVTLYIDGKQLDNRSYFVKDIDATSLYVCFSGTDIAVFDRLPENSLQSTLYSLYNGDFLLAGSGDIWINRESGHAFGEKINTVGEYTIIRECFGVEYAKKVELWKAGYINADSNINILDFIAAMRYISGDESATYVKKGADLDFDGSVTSRDIVKVKRLVLGIDTPPETALTDKWSFEEDVMPIVGFFTPTTSYVEAYSKNITPDLCTNKVYQAISDLGINFLSYIEAYFAGAGDKTANLKNLEMASKYGLGALVTRNDVSNEWTEYQYAAQLSYMAHYPSFEGMVVVDEPHGSGYPDYEVKNTIDNFIIKHSYTKYANMYGYTNLLPYVKGWASQLLGIKTEEIVDEETGEVTVKETEILSEYDDDEVYMDYMREFCEKMQPKHLCWDSYPLGSSSTDFTYYYKNLKAGRQVAKEYNIPFWAFLQTFSRDGEHNTKEEMLWNINTMLAFGLKGVQYYYLVQPHWDTNVSGTGEVYDFGCAGLIGANGEKTPYYDHALAVNKQIMAVDHVLMNSDSEKILAIGTYAQNETGIYDTKYGVLTSATATAERGAIIGCFDYRGKEAFYVSSNSSTEAQTVTLKFDGTHSLELISSTVSDTVSANEYTLNLAAGEAVLIVVD